MENRVRVRFAPSPTGPLHIGGVRTALYNYLFAKKHNGDFLLRIEDTDQTRFVEGAEDYIFQSLEWCGISPNESLKQPGMVGPYKQSERKAIYQEHIKTMLNNGTAYYAFDTPEELNNIRSQFEAEKKTFAYNAEIRQTMTNSLTLSETQVNERIENGDAYVVRAKINPNEEVSFKDEIRGTVTFNTSTLDDKVLFKSDGLPTYHFANVVDDYLMKISHVIRGEEWLPSAPLHVLLYQFLGWGENIPAFAHLPLILKPDGPGKLSKRDGDRLGFPVFPLDWKDPKTGETSPGYKQQGYLSDAFINMLAFLGWNPGTEQEIFTKEELTTAFSLEKVGKSGAKFDPEKAKWFNQQYLKDYSGKAIAELISTDKVDDVKLAVVADAMKERVTFAHEILEQGAYFFEAPTTYDAKTVKKKWKEKSPQIVSDLIAVFENTPFAEEPLENAFKAHLEANEIGFGMGMIALRLAITGVGGGPSLFHIMEIIGKEETISRMKSAIENIKKEPVA